MNRICCARYKRLERNQARWRAPWVKCGNTASIVEFSSNGRKIHFRCKVHKDASDIDWREIEPGELSLEEINAWKVTIRNHIDHCKEQIEYWKALREAAIELEVLILEATKPETGAV